MKQAVKIIKEVKKAVIGKDDVLLKVMQVILAGGNILIEDIPGVGKTTMALAFSKAMQLECKRVQFTPDVLPSDILGFSMYNNATKDFEYREEARPRCERVPAYETRPDHDAETEKYILTGSSPEKVLSPMKGFAAS